MLAILSSRRLCRLARERSRAAAALPGRAIWAEDQRAAGVSRPRGGLAPDAARHNNAAKPLRTAAGGATLPNDSSRAARLVVMSRRKAVFVSIDGDLGFHRQRTLTGE
jgi:hypothetical protein